MADFRIADFEFASIGRFAKILLWIVACLWGPVPWVLLATVGLEAVGGSGGYAVAFIGAPALWTGLSVAALLFSRRWWTILWAAAGTVFGLIL